MKRERLGPLDERVREARSELGRREAAGIDWDAVDRGLFEAIDRIERDQRAERRAELSRGEGARGRFWGLAAAGLGAAAVAALVVGKVREPRPLDDVQATEEGEAGEVVAIDGAGSLLVNGTPAAIGTELHRGDVLEARGAQASIERPGKLTLEVERGTRATVTHVRGALVLSLADGAVEAQVTPVATGEAFAVDVDRSRVAVHGTHLRVERHGDAVVVDLNEGVVSVGDAPRTGSTMGALVTAPAHAQFSAASAEATLSVTHDPDAVRAAALLGAAPVKVSPLPPAATSLPRTAPTEPHGAIAGGPLSHAGTHAPSPASPAPAAAPVDPNAESTLAGQVRRCMTEGTHADGVTVVVSTTLHLELNDDGSVRSARFEPPVAPDVNACAATSIYKTRFDPAFVTRSVAIPVDVRVPSSAP
jgi:ferric-dicitrate binding protein FerR (iron transport regulator)